MAPSLVTLICSVELEAGPVRRSLEATEPLTIGRKSAARGSLHGREVLLLPAGMGKTNAAQGLTALLETMPVAGVISFGVGGAYPGSGLGPGDLALATREVYGDEGVLAPGAWLSTREIGIPLLELSGDPVYNLLELDPVRVAWAEQALAAAGIRTRSGPFVTVSNCSGTLVRGAELASRFDAVCENMEGAACAHVCALYDVPCLEVRGISNAVEDRDLSRWRLRDAAEAAARAVDVLVTNWMD